MNVLTFWITALVFDFLTYVLTAVLTLVTLMTFQEEGWSTLLDMGRALLVLLLFGFAIFPITFIASMFFSVPSNGFVRMTVIYICTGTTNSIILHSESSQMPVIGFVLFIGVHFAGVNAVLVMTAISYPEFKLSDTANALKWLVLLFPHYSLGSSLNNLNAAATTNRFCQQFCDQMSNCTTKESLCHMKAECCGKL